MDQPQSPVDRSALAENFAIEDFFRPGWESLREKTEKTSPLFRSIVDEGCLLREVRGRVGARMQVHDRRSNQTREVLMMGSNNYLGLASEPFVVERAIEAIRKFGVGCGGPPLLNGTTSLHRELEQKLAAMKECEDAAIFSSGYAANVGWSTALLGKGDFLVFDALSHASLMDAIKMGSFDAVPFQHNDVEDLRRKLMEVRYRHPYTNVVVSVEGVYSMDGDIAPLPEVRNLASKYGALVAIDDAHGTGVLGRRGFGTPEHFGLEGRIDIVMGTFSKTFGVTGGFVAGKRALVDHLRFFARSYMFSASLPPPIVAAVLAGIEFLERHPERVTQLAENARYFGEGLAQLGYDFARTTAILPVFVPPAVDLRRLIYRLHEEGVFVNGITYPAVPKNRQRLRVSLMATFTREDLDLALGAFEKVGREAGILSR